MRAYLIDPITRTITEVDYSGDYHQIYTFIGCETFDMSRLNHAGDVVFVDDAGLLKPQPPENFFYHANYPEPLAGRGLVLGTDEEGETVAPSVTYAELTEMIRWSTGWGPGAAWHPAGSSAGQAATRPTTGAVRSSACSWTGSAIPPTATMHRRLQQRAST